VRTLVKARLGRGGRDNGVVSNIGGPVFNGRESKPERLKGVISARERRYSIE